MHVVIRRGEAGYPGIEAIHTSGDSTDLWDQSGTAWWQDTIVVIGTGTNGHNFTVQGANANVNANGITYTYYATAVWAG